MNERCSTPGCDGERRSVETGNPMDVQCSRCERRSTTVSRESSR